MKKDQNWHNHHSVARHLITRIPIVLENQSIKDVLLILEESQNTYDSVDFIYVIDKHKNLRGMFYIQELFNNPKEMKVKRIMQKIIFKISLDAELEKVAHLALKHNLKQVPVVKSGTIIGVVSSREILSTINTSLKRDILHFAGIHKSHLDFENSMDISYVKALKIRLPWIITGLVGAMFIALYMGLFEETLRKYILISAFIPALVYLSGALGNQFQTVLIRDLAVMGQELNLKKYFLKQIIMGLFISSIIGILLFLAIFAIWALPRMAFIISLASFITIIIASFNALVITILIKRFNFDPALGSGPISTIISDMSSIVIYLIIVVLLI